MMSTLVETWLAKIDEQINFYEKYRSRGRKVIEKYRDDISSSNTDVSNIDGLSSYNLLYANTETLKPVLYNRTPRAEARATDKRDDLSRFAAEALEDVLNNLCNNYDFDGVNKEVILDYLLPGTGTSRVVYNPIFRDIEGDEFKVFEEVFTEYVSWENLIIGPAKKWVDVPWLAFRSLLSKEEVEEQFGKTIANELSYNANLSLDNNFTVMEKQQNPNKTELFEIWDKTNKEVIFISRLDKKLISRDDDPLQLTDFFPIPKPLFSNWTNNSIIPIPFYIYYQDLQEELETVSTRITKLIRELKRRGFYNSQVENIEDIVNATDNEFVPVSNYDRQMQSGGIDAIIHELDISRIVQVVASLYQQREQIRFAIFEIMGISDIQRGVIDPRETATASRMKGNFGSLRVSEMQREVQRYVRDLYRIKAEIIAEQFSPETIALITNNPIETVNQIMPLLRAQEPRAIRIDIETDSTIQNNEEGEQERALEFTNVMANLSQTIPAMAQSFGTDFAGELMLSVVRKFKMSRGLEDTLEQQLALVKQQEQQAQEQPQEEPPNTDLIKAQNDRLKLELEAQKAQADNQLKLAELQLKQQEIVVRAQESQARIDLEESKQSLEAAKLVIEQEKVQLEARSPTNEFVGV